MNTEQYWNAFINKHPAYAEKSYTAWPFGAEPDELAALTANGTKTLTCSSLKEYEVENESLPGAGDVSIVLGADSTPKCIIENTNVYTIAFKDADEEIAYKEGEGDRSLSYWRQAHIDFFNWLYPEMGLVFSEDEQIVVEEFKLIYV
ncbi:ASCH domain protein [Jeotgalicoccus saudimassiliensis]|uniref:ASCH domain protein n=1 Tax=Jeotgalicoccus saudimassiliensis TaxID=1461582 RepID=A0A078M0V5_9STAP|nr:ASCH domain-containing protein [Jeotgalicoccus saudimassiliensis]CDZ99032.1 ASCH domain protein [Jeotgalicoccus saudimassiliensis]